MTTSSAANGNSTRPWPVHGAERWLALAAAPTFALMAGIAAQDASAMALCTSSSVLPVDGMTAMYLLMSFFHLSPWLKLATPRPRARI